MDKSYNECKSIPQAARRLMADLADARDSELKSPIPELPPLDSHITTCNLAGEQFRQQGVSQELASALFRALFWRNLRNYSSVHDRFSALAKAFELWGDAGVVEMRQHMRLDEHRPAPRPQ